MTLKFFTAVTWEALYHLYNKQHSALYKMYYFLWKLHIQAHKYKI